VIDDILDYRAELGCSIHKKGHPLKNIKNIKKKKHKNIKKDTHFDKNIKKDTHFDCEVKWAK